MGPCGQPAVGGWMGSIHYTSYSFICNLSSWYPLMCWQSPYQSLDLHKFLLRYGDLMRLRRGRWVAAAGRGSGVSPLCFVFSRVAAVIIRLRRRCAGRGGSRRDPVNPRLTSARVAIATRDQICVVCVSARETSSCNDVKRQEQKRRGGSGESHHIRDALGQKGKQNVIGKAPHKRWRVTLRRQGLFVHDFSINTPPTPKKENASSSFLE